MKKLLIICSLITSASIFSQFTVAVDLPAYYSDSDIYLYGFNGSKEILYSKAKTSNNKAIFRVDKKYIGMMRAFFQKNNSSVNMVSENKNIEFTLKLDDKNKITDVVFNDQTNQIFSKEVDLEKKKDLILPALIQIKDYYNPSDGFYKSLEGEIALLSQKGNTLDNANHPFLSYYQQNQRFSNQENASQLKQEDYLNFFSKSSEYLETSLLLKPALINYLNASKSNVEGAVDKLLETVNIETPRGQTILSELIDIFNTYNMDKLKDKYLTEANNLKCTINDRLASTLKSNNSTSIGQKMPNAIFVNPIHTKAKSLYDIKSSKKIVVFWSSTCSHCEAELPKILEKYEKLKAQNIAVVGFSLDSNLDEFRSKANNYPWISDSEGKGWYSSYGETYNINATPTYFILDADNKIISKPNHVADVLEYLKVN
ncbi:peroxiredoxin family protein [Epilithonimonas vandammei]|uniref:peroxiredoxin family protein n=1 Tax=Epilithonimonas vandammei TaxID=2487072 RepID=UPI0028A1CD8A|nr:thioredoxin-like domain-containing protein [Epilithonimonas vandammei]